MSEHSAAAFFDVWHTYRKVVAANYMHHMEIKAHIEQMLHAQFAARPFSFLDLGCGDAATLAPLLTSMAVQRLALAAENLKALSCPVHGAEGGVFPPCRAEAGEGRLTVADRHRAGRRRKPASLLEAVL